jgi:hypothetical protein
MEGTGRANSYVIEIALACLAFRSAKGRWPNSEEDLRDLVSDEVFTCPRNGVPMRFVCTPQTVSIYNTGFDDRWDEETIKQMGRRRGQNDWGIVLGSTPSPPKE